MKDLERSGAIERYRAVVPPVAVGLTFEALVFVTMGRTDLATIGAFEHAVIDVPGVVTAQRLFGEPDYMLRVLTTNLAGYQRLYDERLSNLPGVQRLTSTMVMKSLSHNDDIPIP